MRRLLVIGCAGAGKSTLARALAATLALPLVELDRVYWRPGWQEPDRDQWRAAVADHAAAPRWVMDGNYGDTFDLRMPLADGIVWLDYPRGICLRRVAARTLRNHGRTREGLPDGCPDRFDPAFLRYIWDFPVKHRPRIEAAIDRFGCRERLWRVPDDATAATLAAQLGAP